MIILVRYRAVWYSILISCLFLLTGCRAANRPEMILPVISRPDPLSGTQWELIAIKHEGDTLDVPAEPRPFIRFYDGTFSIRTGCNDPGGYYVLADNAITVTFSRVTTMSCRDDLGDHVMDTEAILAAVIPNFESYAIEEDILHIAYTDGELTFRRMPD